ncbi:sigma-54-dependent Fis family transcriptional regulator [bacterium]|nr:sigma-54-dependent Fis family transcriptional regulator [bacterium]
MKYAFIVDDEKIMGDFLEEAAQLEGFGVTRVASVRAARDQIGAHAFDVAFMDIRLPDGDGLSIVSDVRARHPRCHICVITAYGTVDTAVSAMKLGADDFLMKPFSVTDVNRILGRALDAVRRPPGGFTLTLLTDDPKMKGILDLVTRVAPTDASILITGESGTGKELIARSLHQLSRRNDFPFVALNCAAIPENLLEAELFGYEKGAFTGAERRKLGLVELAGGGTLFLDEIGELPFALQPKLLRVLEGGEFRRVGGQDTLRADIRVIAATNKNLLDLSKKKQFREDLYYRLNVIPVEIPPLRDRPGDIELLAKFFLGEYADRYEKPGLAFDPAALESLKRYPWPGNVRELENTVQRAVALAEGTHIHSVFLTPSAPAESSPTEITDGGPTFDELVEQYERRLLTEALARAGGNQTEAARILGLKRTTLFMKLKKFGLDNPGD